MCGIAGIVGVDAGVERLERMAASIRHRGPDDSGFHVDQHAGLAFTRLSIVDLEGGHQPMSDRDGRAVVVFNGEIYNHRELRHDLERLGRRFQTDHSDTEVVVQGWLEWGERLVPRLNGMFAFAVWEPATRTMSFARDRFGIKPLYRASMPCGGLVFGSEIRAIHASGHVEKNPEPSSILEYFTLQNLWGERTMFSGIEMMPQATISRWRDGVLTSDVYWEPTFTRSRQGSMEDFAREHRSILEAVVARQTRADVPITTYLSGGIDSTAITAAAHRIDPTVRSYSCIFDLDGVGEDAWADEREFSRAAADALGVARVEHVLSPDSLEGCLDDYVDALEDIRMGMGYVNYLIARRVARDAKVVLSGTGGDEYHGGYVGRYVAMGLPEPGRISLKDRLRAMVGRVPGRWTDELRRKKYHAILTACFSPGQYGDVFEPEFLEEAGEYDPIARMDQCIDECDSENWFDRLEYVDAKTYLHGLLVLEDKISMAHSLETRVPLLDNELIDYVNDLPVSALISGGVGKVVFRESVKPWVPESIYTKPKMGFGPPDASWYRNQLRPWIESELRPQRIDSLGIFRPGCVQNILEAHFSSRANNTYLIWSLLSFNAWCRVNGFYN